MNSMTLRALQFFLWFACVFHVIVGLGLNLSPNFPQAMASYYGAEVNFTPAFLYILKPVGAFMLAVGFMAGAAARDPLGNKAIIYGLVLLFVARGLQRIVFQEEIANAVAIATSRNLVNAVFFLLLAVVLAVLFHLAGKKGASEI